jgi:23S rRNA (cytosine1962-C5)-methyltransferase
VQLTRIRGIWIILLPLFLLTVQTLVIKKGKERALDNRHPWVYSGAVSRMPAAANGDIVQITDQDQHLIGYGFYAPENQIVCRVFEFASVPVQVQDPAYWAAKLRRAWRLRQSLFDHQRTNAYRLVHAEGDFFPGLIADVYGPVVVIQLLIKGTEKLLGPVVSGLQALGFEHIYLKSKEVSRRLEDIELPKGWVAGGRETEVEIVENGLRFDVDVEKGQKTGFFLDQRDNRALLGECSAGRKVLNTFCYSGGFSLYALRAGAQEVCSVDSSRHAIDLCNQNVALNRYDRHEGLVADCFDYLKDMPENRFDCIVLDPPAFAKHADAVNQAARGYKELNLKAFRKIAPDGLLFTFSCSQKIDRDLFRKIIFSAAADAGRNVRILYQLSQPADHPVNIFHPENEYLKGLVLHVE